jgi:Fe-S cluster assembly protein SufD
MTQDQAFAARGDTEAAFAAAFAASGLASRSAAWVRAARTQAIQDFLRFGLPHRKTEIWRYSDIRRALRDTYVLERAATAAGGHAQADIALLGEALAQSDLRLRVLFEAEPDGPSSAMGRLNLAFAEDGVLVRIAAGTELAEPLSVHHDGPSEGAMSHSRNALLLEPGASATLIETVNSGDPGFSTAHWRIDLQDGATLTHIRVVETGRGAVRTSQDRVAVGAKAKYVQCTVQGGEGFLRHETVAELAGEGAETHFAGALAAGGAGHADWRLALAHKAQRTISRLTARSVLGGRSFGAVQGAVSVAPGAQQADSHQAAKALLLSGQAQCVHKPELEIFADDVRCGHGATTGALDPNHLFYLRSRGIPEAAARLMLVEAFLAEAIAGVTWPAAQVLIEGALQRLLATALEARS